MLNSTLSLQGEIPALLNFTNPEGLRLRPRRLAP
jgi:hypothetical protein